MSWQVSQQTRFLLRASGFFGGLLVVWWFLLLGPLLAWTRISTDLLLNAMPGAQIQTGITVMPNGIWVFQAPLVLNGRPRNVRLEAPQRLPIQLTIALPLFWAILLAAPRALRIWRIFSLGTALLLTIPPVALLIYAAHVVKLYVYPNVHPLIGYFLSAADYFASTVAPYVGPVLVAVALHAELRRAVLATDPEMLTRETPYI